MKKIKYLIITVMIISTLFNSGCWNRRELETLVLIMGAGVDWEKDKVVLNVELLNPMRPEEMGEGKPFILQRAEGKTFFEAVRNISHYISRRIHWSHNEIVVLGLDYAKRGNREVLDFYVRDAETRLTTLMMVSTTTARNVLDTPGRLVDVSSTKIKSILEKVQGTSGYSARVNARDFLVALSSKTDQPFLPLVHYIEGPIVDEELGEQVRRDEERLSLIKVEGLAVFRDDKLSGFLDKDETRGMLFIRGDLEGGIINFSEDHSGQAHGNIEILNVKSKISPRIEGEKFFMTIDITVEGNLGEYNGQLDITDPNSLFIIGKAAALTVKGEVKMALNILMGEYELDTLGFGSAFIRKYPKKRKEIENNWEEIFPKIITNVNTKVNIRRVGHYLK